MTSESVVNLAILGAGIFARDAYLPILRRLHDRVAVCAVWSRSQTAAERLASLIRSFSPQVIVYHGDDGLANVLANESIHAVITVLPVQAQLQVALQALHAGKHVLQEKPFAATVKEAQEALLQYRQMPQRPVWGLAENYRSERAFRVAARAIPSLGKLIKLDLIADMPMNPANKYYNSDWRRDTVGCPGGFLMESSVHFIAAIRLLARAGGLGEPVKASAVASHSDKGLSPPDTLTGWLKFENGESCSVSITFAAQKMRFSLSVTGALGLLEVKRGGWGSGFGGYEVTSPDSSYVTEQMGFSGIEDELDSFISMVDLTKTSKGAANDQAADMSYRISITEGAQDICCMEALLNSSSKLSCVVDIPQLDRNLQH